MSLAPIQPPPSDVERPKPLVRLRLDPLLLLATLALCGCSIAAVYAASYDDVPGDPWSYAKRQAVYIAVGLVLMYGLSRLDYSRLRELKYGLLGVMVVSVVAVSVLAGANRGTRAWFELGFFNLQPSEPGKLLFIAALAAFAVDRVRSLGERQTTARLVLIAVIPAMLVLAQDLGTSLVYLFGAAGVLFVAGTPTRHFAVLLTIAVTGIVGVLVVAPKLGVEVLEPYQKDRLTSFLDRSSVAGEEGYQQTQSINAIGSGEKLGRGLEQATQTRLDFLPEPRTDFIFAVIGEVYGFVGAALVLSLYALLIWRALHILTVAKNLYGALIAGGISVMLLAQVFVNVGMSVGIMPITGVPAPLLSFGGSSMLATLMAVGLLQSIHAGARETAARKAVGIAA